jgi:hypothetical protein
MISRLNFYFLDKIPLYTEWRGLMYHHMLSAARQGRIDALDYCVERFWTVLGE